MREPMLCTPTDFLVADMHESDYRLANSAIALYAEANEAMEHDVQAVFDEFPYAKYYMRSENGSCTLHDRNGTAWAMERGTCPLPIACAGSVGMLVYHPNISEFIIIAGAMSYPISLSS